MRQKQLLACKPRMKSHRSATKSVIESTVCGNQFMQTARMNKLNFHRLRHTWTQYNKSWFLVKF